MSVLNKFSLIFKRWQIIPILGALLIYGSCLISSCTKIPDTIQAKWVDNKNVLDANANITSVQAIASLKIKGINNPVVTGWDCKQLPSYIHKNENGNAIVFTLDTTVSHQPLSFDVYAIYNNLMSNKLTFSVNQYTSITYDNEIILTSTDNAKLLTQSRKEITLTASIQKKIDQSSVTGNVTWNISSLPGFIQQSIDAATNSLTFKLVDGEETVDGSYVIQASYNPTQTTGAATKEFILETEDWYHWENDWVPKSAFVIDSNGVLKGFKSGVDLSSFDTLHIPREVKGISTGAFMYNYQTRIPSNIINIDFSAATQLTSIGNDAFYKAPFTNPLVLPSAITNIGESCFYSTKITSIDLSQCSLLMKIPQGAFSDCKKATSISFNDNLQEISDATGAGDGAFAMTTSDFSGDLILPSHLRKIGTSAFSCLGGQIWSPNPVNLVWNQCTNLKTIGKRVFASVMFANQTLVIPDMVTTIELNAFDSAKGVNEIDVPSSVTTIGGNCMVKSSVKVVKLLKDATSGYAYNLGSNPSSETANANFEKWLRTTDIDPGYTTNSRNGAHILVPSSMDSWYRSNWPSSITITTY